jgi:hypothetical protein
MGFLRRGRRRIDDGVPGEARVLRLAPTARPGRRDARRGAEYELVLDLGDREVDLIRRIPDDRMLAAGQTVPVLVSASDPERVDVDLDRVSPSAAAAGSRPNPRA